MTRILLVEEAPDLGAFEARILERDGHVVFRCNGAPSGGGACPMLRTGSCTIADAAEMILFACSLYMPMQGRSYNGMTLLNAYRHHPVYSKLPMLIVTLGAPEHVAGTGPVEIVEKFSDPTRVIEAARRLIARIPEKVS